MIEDQDKTGFGDLVGKLTVLRVMLEVRAVWARKVLSLMRPHQTQLTSRSVGSRL
jgi:hypothetical protein